MKGKQKIVIFIIMSTVMILNTLLAYSQHSTILVTNPSSLERNNELINLKRAEVEKKLGPVKYISIMENHKNIEVQYDDPNADGRWDEAVFLLSLKPHEKATLKISAANHNSFSEAVQRAHVRLRKKNSDDSFDPYIFRETMPVRNPATDFEKQRLPPYLTEGPAWENDKVAFRLYFDVRNNKDIYGKTTDRMMMDTVGVNYKNSYHQLSDWGMDILHVVKSLGAGALALSVPRKGMEDTLIRLGGQDITKTIYQEVADGPLLAKFTLSYDWQINHKPVKVKEEISIWGGQYFYDSKVTVKGAPQGAGLVTGIADFYENTFESFNNGKAVVGFSYGKQSENKDNLGLGILVNRVC